MTFDIHPIGGGQAYTAGKARWLEKCGWNVIVLFMGSKTGKCDIEYLNKFLLGGNTGLKCPPYNLDECTRNNIVKDIIDDNIGIYKKANIIIESHYDVMSFWGEILAEELKCRHYIFCCNEYYRSKNGYRTFYKDNLDFFYFKFSRNELVASSAVIGKLFEGYKGVVEARINYPDLIVEQDPIQNIDFSCEESLFDADWNICCIGRTEKPYVKFAIEGIKKFAIKYNSKRINLIIVGNEKPIRDVLYNAFRYVNNVRLVFLGVLVPIPRELLKKMDVVIAAAQTARFVSYENVYVITANVMSTTTPGVLGYDTQDSWYGGETKEYCYDEVLEDLLVFAKYKDKVFSMPKRETAEYHYKQQWDYLNRSSSKVEYFTQQLKKYRGRDWIALFPFWGVGRGDDVIIYGAGTVGKDYVYQIENSKYCNLIAVVDKNFNEFDSSVCKPEDGLKNNEYDVVVIATTSDIGAKQMIDNVKKITINKRIIYDIKVCWT